MVVLGWAVVLVLVVLGGVWCFQNIERKPSNPKEKKRK